MLWAATVRLDHLAGSRFLAWVLPIFTRTLGGDMALRKEPSPRFKIKTLSKQLRKLSFPTSPISVQLATYAADAFDKYLSGECSLETAFGLGKKRGAPGWPRARLKLAKA